MTIEHGATPVGAPCRIFRAVGWVLTRFSKPAPAGFPPCRPQRPGSSAARSQNRDRPTSCTRPGTTFWATSQPIPRQQIGDCVSFGHGHASDLLQCVEIALEALTAGESSPLEPGQAAAEYREIDTEFIYATSREVAGILSGAEGSYGAAAVKAMTSIGLVSREMLGQEGVYSGDRAQMWGRTVRLPKLKLRAASFRLGSAALVSTWDELEVALASGYPVTICTDQRFCLTRDEQGFCKPEGNLGHCMFIAGLRFDRPGACIVQSWGPDVPTGPRALDQPSFSFWADRSVVEAILAQGDSWALSIAPEFVTPFPSQALELQHSRLTAQRCG